MKEPVVLNDEDIEEEVEDTNLSKGKITQVSFSKNRDMGNFIHEKIELTSTVGESEEVEDVIKYLREEVEYLLYLND